jgi:hypothetical protein
MGLVVPMGTYIAQHPQLVDKAEFAVNDYYVMSIRNYAQKSVWLGTPTYVTGMALFDIGQLLSVSRSSI